MMKKQFEIVDQQTDFVVINKRPNVNFHDEDELGSGLFNQVKQYLAADELYPVHRLDKMTSGLIVFAKNLVCAQQFQLLFSQHEIQKYYLAISDKKPKKKQGLIKGDMVKSRRGSWKLLRTQTNPAIRQFFSYAIGGGKRLYLIKPHSGKTHQIRVALSSIGAPILGDVNYYPKQSVPIETNEQHLFDRGYLHAYSLTFELAQKQYQYVLPPTDGVEFLATSVVNTLDELKQPWLLDWPKV